MNERIEKAYAQRPKRWVFELSVAVIVTALIVWSATAVETSGTTQNGGKIALNILSENVLFLCHNYTHCFFH